MATVHVNTLRVLSAAHALRMPEGFYGVTHNQALMVLHEETTIPLVELDAKFAEGAPPAALEEVLAWLGLRAEEDLDDEEKAVSRILDTIEKATGKVIDAKDIELGPLGRPDSGEWGCRVSVLLGNGHTVTFHGFGFSDVEALDALRDEVADLYGIDTPS